MMYKGLFVDDSKDDVIFAEHISENSRDMLKFEFRLADKKMEELAGEIFNQGLDILALDYRLDEVIVTDSIRNPYKAGPLAQQLKRFGIRESLKGLSDNSNFVRKQNTKIFRS